MMKKYNLLKNLYNFKPIHAKELADCIEERIAKEDAMEPMSDGQVHDEWEERNDDLQNILTELEDYISEEKTDETEFDGIISMISEYQLTHGRLSRENVWIMEG